MKKSNLKDWNIDDRPREKLLSKGQRSLSNSELLAILLGSGNREETAVDLAKRILLSVDNNWNRLAQLSLSQLCKFKGIGQAKAITIITALEIGKRRNAEAPTEKIKLTNSKRVYNALYPTLSDLPHEEFWVMYLDNACHEITRILISKGGITDTTVDVRLIYKYALEHNATGIILAHNHPSGNLEPSKSDIQLTQKIAEVSTILQVKLLDHLIISQQNYYSFSDNDLI